jgi:predicted nucleic acid-binding protein
VIIQQLRRRLRVVSLTEAEYIATIEDVAARGLMGAMVYDALLMRCAVKCQATRIVTWNAKHFKLVAPELAASIATP